MGLQKFRADKPEKPRPNGSVAWYTRWVGGPSLALVRNCDTPFGPRTVYATGEPDTWFSVPAACSFKGRTVRGYLTSNENGWEFTAYRYSWAFPHVDREDPCVP